MEIDTRWCEWTVRPRRVPPVTRAQVVGLTKRPKPEPGPADVFKCVIHDGDDDWLVETEWELLGARLEPTEVIVRAHSIPHRPVTADVMKRIPIGVIHRLARRKLVERSERVKRGERRREEFARRYERETGRPYDYYEKEPLPDWLIKTTQHQIEMADAAVGPRRGSPLAESELEAIAVIYKTAADNGWPVTRAVADAFQISPSTAGKRIMRARAAGLLDDYPKRGTK
jgi:hypothetical protein